MKTGGALICIAIWSFIRMLKTLHAPSGDALLYLFASAFLFVFGCVAIIRHQENEEAAKDPEYVKGTDFLIPIFLFLHWQELIMLLIVFVIWLNS